MTLLVAVARATAAAIIVTTDTVCRYIAAIVVPMKGFNGEFAVDKVDCFGSGIGSGDIVSESDQPPYIY